MVIQTNSCKLFSIASGNPTSVFTKYTPAWLPNCVITSDNFIALQLVHASSFPPPLSLPIWISNLLSTSWLYMIYVLLRQIVYVLFCGMMLQLQWLYPTTNRPRIIPIYAEARLISSSSYNWPKLRNGVVKRQRPSSTAAKTATITTTTARKIHILTSRNPNNSARTT